MLTTARLHTSIFRCARSRFPRLHNQTIVRASSSGPASERPPKIHPDSLTRYPGLSTHNGLLRTLDWIGTVAFATSGTLTAGYAGMDLLGCSIVGTITAVGGGTVRDMCIGSFPVSWMVEYEYILLCLATCGVTLFCWGDMEKQGIVREDGPVMFWTDTLGIGAFCVIGAQTAVRAGLHPVICIISGLFTSTFGGLIRDVLCERPPRILHNVAEVYASTAISGATVYMGVRALGGSPALRIVSGMFTAMFLRYYATSYNFKLSSAHWKDSAHKIITTEETEQPSAALVTAGKEVNKK